ncbi:T9SS type A sorting domain-containing protein [Prevotella sp. 10(H)]|uniref:T9SS type A sorting domain-containing protein n=1 Tax=Prevotella sp. 10(H) TaxID=1158294 RepID=UPI0004A6C24C|nr:T9SS type A sorting domain-containing protein [Prevotella sp. 10(H)]
MKSYTLLLLAVGFLSLPCHSQLSSHHYHLRSGDTLVKQQVEYRDPGPSGTNRLWDFSNLKTLNEAYTLSYELPPVQGDSIYILGDKHFRKDKTAENELIVGTEHNTMYYYHMHGDSLCQTGHENPAVELKYTRPVLHVTYPFNYGDAVVSDYESKGLYSSTIPIHTRGQVTTKADAYGKLVLPTGDTLDPVLRLKTVQTIENIPQDNAVNTPNQEVRLVETCRWYSKGYRYPVFETVRSLNQSDSTEVFSTAFFFPPQDHLYLDTDPENLALLEEMWDMENKEKQQQEQAVDSKTVKLEDILECRIYPNPVESVMNLEYELKQDAQVSFELYSMDGMPVRRTKAERQVKGTYHQTIDCSVLHPRNYVLRITANGITVNQVVIKK